MSPIESNVEFVYELLQYLVPHREHLNQFC